MFYEADVLRSHSSALQESGRAAFVAMAWMWSFFKTLGLDFRQDDGARVRRVRGLCRLRHPLRLGRRHGTCDEIS